MCAKIADQKKALDIVVLDVSKLTFFTSYFVICT
ncbi:MAG: RsfS/YbeB/iojap family protein, partial [Planctomycetes bacterium]|nr:RsfS/YbeB/iojap family protein [Planctomycetota bacterium]